MTDDRTNWWLGLVQSFNTRIYDTKRDPVERAVWADISAGVLGIALDTGGLDEREVTLRLLTLCHHAAALGDPPARLDPDTLARRGLALIPLPREEAVRRAANWRDRPIEEIRNLRNAKNVTGALDRIAHHIRDPDLQHEVRAWAAVRDQLP
ncbi:hypothetical protein [Saccharothrix sp.]|uniref:hypothetical protein n=1 Tax=Saccharothrix sp. TaxID=1873460 RepID=UPI002810E802|nr:hypothetical protein [Saccharothrix sp.]